MEEHLLRLINIKYEREKNTTVTIFYMSSFDFSNVFAEYHKIITNLNKCSMITSNYFRLDKGLAGLGVSNRNSKPNP